MEETMINRTKWFWGWQDDREEEWLGEMSRQGWHLVRPAAFGQYTFVQGAGREYAYRLDFVTAAQKKEDYFQLFRDAGWEHVGEMGGWQYWRKEIVEGMVPEIFTDNASKVQKYQRLIGVLAAIMPIFVIFLVNFNRTNQGIGDRYGSAFGVFYEILFFIFFTVVMIFVYSMVMILRRINRLKRGL